jgi:AraC-like DNA-binding protein/uncharacterized protein YjlB
MISKNIADSAAEALTARLDSIVFRAGWRHWVAAGPGAWHNHPGWEMVYHPANSGNVQIESGARIDFGPGDVVITPPGLRHFQTNSEPGRDFCIVFSAGGSAVKSAFHTRGIKDSFILRETAALTSGGWRSVDTEDKVLNYRTRALLAALLAETQRSPKPEKRADHILTARRLMEDFYSDPSLEIKQIARKCAVSGDYLRHLFQSGMGVSPKQYLLKLRLGRTRELLRHSDLPLKEIASLSGFANERYLCHCFKLSSGMTPGEFRHQKKQS